MLYNRPTIYFILKNIPYYSFAKNLEKCFELNNLVRTEKEAYEVNIEVKIEYE